MGLVTKAKYHGYISSMCTGNAQTQHTNIHAHKHIHCLSVCVGVDRVGQPGDQGGMTGRLAWLAGWYSSRAEICPHVDVSSIISQHRKPSYQIVLEHHLL